MDGVRILLRMFCIQISNPQTCSSLSTGSKRPLIDNVASPVLIPDSDQDEEDELDSLWQPTPPMSPVPNGSKSGIVSHDDIPFSVLVVESRIGRDPDSVRNEYELTSLVERL